MPVWFDRESGVIRFSGNRPTLVSFANVNVRDARLFIRRESMSRSLIRDSAVYSVGILLTRALGFLLIPLYTRYLTVADYGALSLLVLFLQGINFLCLLGISSAAVRLHFTPAADEASRVEVYGNATLLLLIFPGLVLLGLGPVSWWLTSSYLPAIPFYPYVMTVLLMGLFTPMIGLMSGLLTAQRRPGAYIAFHLSYFSVQSIAIIVVIAGFALGLKGQVFSQLLTSVFFGAIAVAILARYARPRYSRETTRQLLAFGVPLVPFFLASWIDAGAGRFALESYLDLQQVGLFALASQFAGILTLISSSLDQALLPHFLRRATDVDGPRALGALIARYLALFGVLALGIVIVAGPTIALATTPAYFDAIRYVAPLILANLLYVARSPIMWSLSHSHRTGLLSAINLVSTAVLVFLLVVLLGRFQLGIAGVAYAMIAANLVALVAGGVLAQRSFPLQLPWGTLIGVGGILVTGTLLILGIATLRLESVGFTAQVALLLAVTAVLWRVLAIGNPARLLGLGRSSHQTDARPD